MKSLNRRTFLAGSAALLAAPAVRANAQSGDVDVLIVGAGAAGIAAARKLAAAGRSFTLLEASPRIGGRCITDTTSFNVPFDRGAHWIHAPDVNPLTKLAQRTGLDIYPAPSGQRVRVGRRNARESELEDYLAAVVRSHRAIDTAARGKTDMSCAQALPNDLGEWRPAVEFALGPYGTSKDLTELSAQDFSKSVERDVGAFCRQGYGALLARLADGIPAETETPVTEIDTAQRGRIVATTPRGSLNGSYMIVTASIGVLASGKIKFDRAGLPKRQLDAIDRLKLGSFDHIALDLPGNPLGLQRDDLVFEKATDRRTAALLANVSGTSLTLVEVAGRFGRELAARGEAAMGDFATEWLGNLFGTDVKRAVKRTRATQWNADPWTLGAFSAAAPGGQWARRALMEPVRDRIYFAGEAAHETLWGTVGGAWESGERAADAVLRRLAGAPAPPPPRTEQEAAPTPQQRRQQQRGKAQAKQQPEPKPQPAKQKQQRKLRRVRE
ncbi:MAG: FAD-dependent oxidoreductase [Alphaproteobacteria bacterium]|nr:FAD-dependent oxidoreductase [Alphaproteobacteria bacterium]